jgi:hypothetical protein
LCPSILPFIPASGNRLLANHEVARTVSEVSVEGRALPPAAETVIKEACG